MQNKSIHFNGLQHSIGHYWTPLDMAEVDALSATIQPQVIDSLGAFFFP
jgi:hypothetical protein